MVNVSFPLDVTLRDVENTEAIDASIKKRAEKLHQYYDRITFCKVAVAALQKNQHQGKLFQVNIELNVPGKMMVANRHSHRNEDLYVAIRDSFNAIKRQLEEHIHKLREDNKTPHTLPLNGTIVRLFDYYGFIEDMDGNEYYFHEDNVLQPEFSHLIVGNSVKFLGSASGEAWQAHHVTSGG
jgi:ribosomal subunit interface protein